MNNGFFNFPSVNDPALSDIKEFDVSGTYRIPAGTSLIYVFAVGAGGGGGSGRRRATGSVQSCFGGGSGAGGSVVQMVYLIQQIPGDLLYIEIGAGGNGGAGRTTDGTNGAAGTVGGGTSVNLDSSGNYKLLRAVGGGPGGGGSISFGVAGTSRLNVQYGYHSASQSAGSGGVTTGTNTLSVAQYFAKGGAGGAGLSGASTYGTGGNIGISSSLVLGNPDYSIGTLLAGMAADAGTAAPSSTGYFLLPYTGGLGGPGGAGGNTVAASAGGAGWRGGGGGGGGASRDGVNSGAGGRGGDGYVAIFCYK